MRGANVTIISRNRKVIRTAKRALVSAGARACGSGFEIASIRQHLSESRDLVVIDADEPAADVSAAILEVSKRVPGERVLVLCSDLSNSVGKLILEGQLDHVIAKRAGMDEAELIVTCQKLLSGKIFGLARHLGLRELDIRSHSIDHSSMRTDVLEELRNYLTEIDCHESVKSIIVTVADELLMNAIFSAPRDARGQPKYDGRNRRDHFVLEPNERVQFQYGCDGRQVAMSVSDTFGSLSRSTLLEYLGAGLSGDKGKMSTKATSAGLGLHMVFNSITHLVFNLDVGRRTEVIASFSVRGGSQALKSSGQSLNIFIDDKGDKTKTTVDRATAHDDNASRPEGSDAGR